MRRAEVILDGMVMWSADREIRDPRDRRWLREARLWILRRFRPRRWTHVELVVDGDCLLDFIA